MAKAKYPVKSLAKAMQLLDALGEFENGTNIASLSKKLRMGKSTVHRLLATLREFDLVWFDASNSNYALGAKLLRWGNLLTRQNLLIRRGLPRLRQLADICGETTNLAVLDGSEVIYMAQFESRERLRLSEAVGMRGHANCTALGKALLATLSEDAFNAIYPTNEPLKAMTANSISDKRHLWDHLEKVRQEGVSYDFEENVIGVICIGAVVRDHAGRPTAAVSISMPTLRLHGEKLIVFKRYLLEAAARLSADLGCSEDAGQLEPPAQTIESPPERGSPVALR